MNRVWHLIIIVLVTGLMQGWVLDKNNFFLFDDYSHFLNTENCKLSVFPQQMYNDRPLGSCFIVGLYSIFGWNNYAHHLALLLVHVVNGLLLYSFTARFLKADEERSLFASFIGSLLFLNYSNSILAIRWDSAVFDLLATTLILLTLNFSYIRNKYISSIMMFFSYLLALRTKEFTTLVPIIYIFEDIVNQAKKSIRKTYIFLGIMGLSYALVLKTLGDKANFNSLNDGGPYEVSYSLSTVALNMVKFLLLYFDFSNSDFSFNTIKIHSILFMILFITIIIKLLFVDFKKTIVAIFGLVISLLPVAILANTQHRLYLYFPSIFIALLMALAVKKLYTKSIYTIFGITIIFLSYMNFINYSKVQEKKWWLQIGSENAMQHQFVLNSALSMSCTQIWSDDSTNIFTYGPGNYLKLILNNKNHIVTLLRSSEINTNKFDVSCNQLYVNGNDIRTLSGSTY